jgi:hypothetical protein
MVFAISLLLIAQGSAATSKPLWASPDILIEDSLSGYVDFAADYNYTTGDIYVACIPDSGTYFGPDNWGILLLRSTDHGLSWNLLANYPFAASGPSGSLGKEIDLVVTRYDTLYVFFSRYDKSLGSDLVVIGKIYEAGGIWNFEYPLFQVNATETHSLKLVRDDFDDFYMYMLFLIIEDVNDTYIAIFRSTNRGNNWSTLVTAGADEYQDADITVADSTLYGLWTFQDGGYQYLQYAHWRSRANAGYVAGNLFMNDTSLYVEMKYPRIGVTTTLPDSEQLVYAFYSQENSFSGDHDLLYLYSEEGGKEWPTTIPGTLIPDTLVKGSSSAAISDLRGYQADTNRWMNVAYCFTSSSPSPNFENFWCWSEEGSPTNWQGTTSVATGPYRSVPELVYSPGAPGGGGAVVFNDFLGNLWFNAPWYSGIPEEVEKDKDIIRSQIVLPGSIVEISSAGATVYDITGRAIRILNTNSWDLKDREGKKVKAGIYFVVDKENGTRLKLSVLE